MDLIITLVVGLVAGVLAGMIMKGGYGIIGDLIVGILGAYIGSWILDLAGLSVSWGIIGQILTAVLGAVVLIAVLRAIKKA